MRWCWQNHLTLGKMMLRFKGNYRVLWLWKVVNCKGCDPERWVFGPHAHFKKDLESSVVTKLNLLAEGCDKALSLKELFCWLRGLRKSEEVIKTTSTVFLFQFFQVKATKWKYNEYTDEFEAGKLTCFTCHTFGLFPHRGSRIKDYGTKNECKPCQLGIIYRTHKDVNSCDCFKPCTVCSIGPKEEFPCYLESDISEFKPCSACCNNDGGMRVEQYGEQKMPKNVEYSYTNRGGNACGHRGSEERKSVSLLVLAVIVAVGIIVTLVTIVLAVLCGRQRFPRLNGSNHLLMSPQGKGRNCSSNYKSLLT